MPKAPQEGGVFGWRRSNVIRKIARSDQREAREMRVESVAKSIQMLKGILDGKTYLAVAQVSGLSRSTSRVQDQSETPIPGTCHG